MTLNDILQEWDTDSTVGLTHIDETAARTIKHHAKYLAYMREAVRAHRNAENQMAQTLSERTDWYAGRSKNDTGKAYPYRLDKSEIRTKVEADPAYISAKNTERELADMVQTLKEILDAINRRGFLLKTAVDYLRFKNGLS